MDSYIFKGKWKQFKGGTERQWGKLANDDVDIIIVEREIPVGKIQERYGYAKDKAEQEYAHWSSNYRG